MPAVVNRIRLKDPLEDDVYAAAQRDLAGRVAEIDGIQALYLIRVGDDELIVVILGDTEQAIDQMREQVGNDWMRAHVVPHAAAPPERVVGELVTVYERR